MSQNRLAVTVGISRQYLSDIENRKAIPSDEVKDTLLESLERLNPDAPLTMMIDYVRIRFPTLDMRHVIEDILRLKLDFMIHEDFGFYGYNEHYWMGDIFVLTSPVEENGILLELKGKGCRQYESFLLAQHRSWYDFFLAVLLEGAVFKRLDLAINDMAGILDIPELTRKCSEGECVSRFRSFKSYRSGELTRRDEKLGMGNTLYIGSLTSEVYFCAYEKDYEQYIKHDIAIEETPIKNRFEIRLKTERAYYAVRDLLAHNDPERTAFDIINRYIRFADRDDALRPSEWQTSESWLRFLGRERGQLKLTTQPEPYSFERTLNWLHRQVAPTLKVAMKLDEVHSTTIIKDMIDNAKLTDRLEKVLKQQSVSISEMVVSKQERKESEYVESIE